MTHFPHSNAAINQKYLATFLRKLFLKIDYRLAFNRLLISGFISDILYLILGNSIYLYDI